MNIGRRKTALPLMPKLWSHYNHFSAFSSKPTSHMQPRHLLHSGKRCYQYSILSPRIRKQTVCICENRDADQLCSNCTSDRHLCYRIIDSTIPPLTKSEMTAQAGLCQTSSEPRLFVFPSKGWFNINRIYMNIIIFK